MDTTAIECLVGREHVASVIASLSAIVLASFEVCPVRALTRSAVKARVDIAVALLGRLKGDLKWSLPRVLDHLPAYLVYELEGVRYEPATGATWTTSAARSPGGLVFPS